MSYTRDQILRHVSYYEAVSGTASKEGAEILGDTFPLMISPQADNEEYVSLFVLQLNPPHKSIDILVTTKSPKDFDELVDEFLELVDKRTVALIYQGQNDIPKDVRRYYYEHRDQGNSKSKSFALAWSRYCKYKHPDSPRCKQKEYFKGRK